MKKLATLLIPVLLLSACSARTIQVTVSYDTTDTDRLAHLKETVGHVIEGRLLAQKKELVKQDVATEDETEVRTITASDKEGAKRLLEGLLTPFTMEIMKQVGEGQGDIKNEKFGEFAATGLTTQHFDWVSIEGPIVEGMPTQASITIDFTEEGKRILKDIFKNNKGDTIGIFVREQLMSKKLIDATDATKDAITIDGIPSQNMARAFADDVNVGLHVNFAAAK